MDPRALPIDELLPQIRASLAAHPRLVLEAPPGAGKTTQVPPALLDAAWLAGARIVMLEPRRVAARAAAQFMAQQRGENVGATIGYRIRFDNQITAGTRIEVVTEGILTRMLQDDPALAGIGALLFDEFHERHLAGDLGLALALDVQASLRPDLRIVLMSATLDGARWAQFLDAPRLSSAGRGFPVASAHFAARRGESPETQARRAIEHALAEHRGDVLVFLPGQREIARVQAALSGRDAAARADVCALHGDLPVEQQTRVLQPGPTARRRVVLATNVAESSVTLPGVRVVIDTGLAREPRYDPNSGFSRLDLVAITQASAEQRAGRAGRVAAGWAYRLWPQSQRLEPQRRPEMAQVELAGFALELAAWGSAALRFIDPPPPGALAAARELLQRLGALDGAAITARGRRMLALGAHPRLAAMLLAPHDVVEAALACDLAALIEARDPLRPVPGGRLRSDALAVRWQALAAFRHGRATADAARPALAAIDQAAGQWRQRLRLAAAAPDSVPAHALGDVLLHAFPDRIARQHPDDPRRYQLANGRSARLGEDSALYGEPWLAISALRSLRQPHGDRHDAIVVCAAPLDEARLRRDLPQRYTCAEHVRWDAQAQAIVATRERRFDRIMLDSRALASPDPALCTDALLDAVRQAGLSVLPWTEPLMQWRARVRCLHAWMPQLGLPDLSDGVLLARLDAWLRPVLAGKTRLAALTQIELGEALQAQVGWALRARIDAYAPTRMRVPSGQDRRIAYAFDEDAAAPRAPVLAVKLQELFGLAATPRVADGRIALTLHLLSPAGRPLQITSDLSGFWARTYPQIRQQLKARYPRHPWPDDPGSATATDRVRPRN